MKRNILSALLSLALILCLTISVCAAAQHDGSTLVYDEADLLTPAEEAVLDEKLQAISQAYSAEVVIYTVPTANGKDTDDLVEDIYDGMGFGYGPDHDGVLLLVCMDPREYRILSNGFAAEAILPEDIDSIGDSIVSDLSDGDYAGAFDDFADECDFFLNGYINGFPFDAGFTLIVSLIIGLVVGLIVALVLKGQLKSVRKQDHAAVYVKAGSMQVNSRSDLFLYRNITRTKKESSSSSSSSKTGPSRNVGGGSF